LLASGTIGGRGVSGVGSIEGQPYYEYGVIRNWAIGALSWTYTCVKWEIREAAKVE